MPESDFSVSCISGYGSSKATWANANASTRPARRGRRPWHAWKLLVREPGYLRVGHLPPRRIWSAAGSHIAFAELPDLLGVGLDHGLADGDYSSSLARIRIEETTCVILALKADHYIVRVTHDDHAAGGLALSPALGPQVESVVITAALLSRRMAERSMRFGSI
jgi:hypothetical protein